MSKKIIKKAQVVTNQEYFNSLIGLLDKAKKQIDILAFSFAIGSAAGKLNKKTTPYQIALKLRELKEKKGDTLHIRVFLEGIRETSARNRVSGDFLEESGIEVKYGSTHAKGLCIDNRIVFFGSTNLTHQSMTKNNEANLLLEDALVAKQFTTYFDHLWEEGQHGEISLEGPLLADGEFKDVLIETVKKAKKEIHFSIYFFNHREIEKALIEAHQRGVKVTGFIHQHASFAYPYIRANKATVKRMRGAGIDDLYFGPPHTFSHSKYLVADKKEILLGTGNWLVEDVEIHPQLYIHLKDPAIGKELVKHVKWQISSQATDDLAGRTLR